MDEKELKTLENEFRKEERRHELQKIGLLNEIDKEKRTNRLLVTRIRFAMALVYPSVVALFVILFLPTIKLDDWRSRIATGLLTVVVGGGLAFIFGKKQHEGVFGKIGEALSKRVKNALHIDTKEDERKMGSIPDDESRS